MTKTTASSRFRVGVTRLVLAVLVLCALVVSVEAQTVPVRLIGAVQWIGGQKMALALDDGASVHVDLASVEQEAQRAANRVSPLAARRLPLAQTNPSTSSSCHSSKSQVNSKVVAAEGKRQRWQG